MKTYVCLSVLLCLILIFTPAVTLSSSIGPDSFEKAKEVWSEIRSGDGAAEEKSSAKKSAEDETTKKDSAEKEATVEVMLHAQGSTVKLTEREYLCGAVAGEMPATYESEALKAQTVACYTYLKTKEAAGVTITDNPNINQAYLSKSELKNKWGDKFEKYYSKIESAVDAVYGECLIYDGELVKTIAYHAISPGKTDSASDIWGGAAISYLSSVDSSLDKYSPDYSRTVIIKSSDLKELLSVSVKDIDFTDTPSKWISDIKTTPSGAVKSLNVCGTQVDSATFRAALKIRSFHFEVKYKNKAFEIVTRGYGHGVGMSQYGANELARAGKNYEEILKHYYPGTQVRSFLQMR